LQIERRAADDLEHVGGCGLPLQRPRKSSVRACTSSNSRTFEMATPPGRRRLNQFDCLSVNGRTSCRQGKHADGFAFAPEGNPEIGAVAAEPLADGQVALRFVGQQINGLNRDARCRGASRRCAVDRRIRFCESSCSGEKP
jgi:hypothetical protein